MSMSRVQFRKGLSMAVFMERYGTEAKCHSALITWCWPQGFPSPCCGDGRHSTFVREEQQHWQCHRCRRQTTVTAGTTFETTKLPLTRWFLAMHLMTQAKNNVSALELMRHLVVSHKLLQVMAEREDRRVLDGRVEVDDAYLGGKRLGADESDRLHQGGVTDWANKALAASARVTSDALNCFTGFHGNVTDYRPIVVGSGRQAVATHPEFRRVNTVLSNLKTAISGTYHHFNFAKYADRNLAEVQYRFNRRFDLKPTLVRLVRAAVLTHPRPEPMIRLAEVGG